MQIRSIVGGVVLAWVAGSAAHAQGKLVPLAMPSGCYDDWQIVSMNNNGDIVGFAISGNNTLDFLDPNLDSSSCYGDSGIFLYTNATGQTQLLNDLINGVVINGTRFNEQGVFPFGVDDNGAVYLGDGGMNYFRLNSDGTFKVIPTITNGTTQVGPTSVTSDGQLMMAMLYDSNGNSQSFALWKHHRETDQYTVTTVKQPLPAGATTFQMGGSTMDPGHAGLATVMNKHAEYLVSIPGPPVHSYIYQVQNGAAVRVADLGVGNVPTALNNYGDATGYTVAPGAGLRYSNPVQAFVYHAQDYSGNGSPLSGSGTVETLNIPSTCDPSMSWIAGPWPFAINDSGAVAGTVCNMNAQPGVQYPYFVTDVWVRSSSGNVQTLGSGGGTIFPASAPSDYLCADYSYSAWTMVGGSMNNRGDIVGKGQAFDYDGCYFQTNLQGWIYQP
jgi:hypothetical protein